MHYPEYFTADDIAEFEYEYNRYLDLQDPHSTASVNAECRRVAEEQQDVYYDELERDHDEQYEPDYGDSWYDDQYELEADYI